MARSSMEMTVVSSFSSAAKTGVVAKRRRDRSPGRTAGLKQGGKEVVSKSMEPTSTKLKAISDRMLSETERGQV